MRRLLAVLLLLALPLPAAGTSVRLRTLPEMVSEADRAVQGRVVAVRPVQDGPRIYTEYDVEVAEWLKSGPRGEARTLTLRQPGGTIGDVTMTVIGAAHFTAGQEVVVFTKDYGGLGHQQVVNLAQGALPIETERVPPGRAVSEARRRVPQAGSFPDGAPDDLEAFKARVRELAAGR